MAQAKTLRVKDKACFGFRLIAYLIDMVIIGNPVFKKLVPHGDGIHPKG